MRRASTAHLLLINAYWLGLSFMWNSLHVIILPAVLLNYVPGTQKNSYLGLLTFFGLIAALIVQPVSGALSDCWPSRWGRRRPLIGLGTALDFVFLTVLGLAAGFWGLFVGYLGLQLSSNLAHGPVQALVPDQVPAEQLGAASGYKNIADMLGLVISSLLIGRLVPPDVSRPTAGMAVITAILALCAAMTLAGAHELPSGGLYSRRPRLADAWRRAFALDLQGQAGYWWLIGSRLLYLFGIYGIQVFAQYFVRDRLNVPNPVRTTGDMLAAIILALMACAFGAGWLCDRWGRRPIQAISGVLGAAGVLLLTTVNTQGQLLLYGTVVGAGMGLFLTANWALCNELAPPGEGGKYLGLTNLATAGAGAAGRLEGPLIDALNNAQPGRWLGYTLLFALGAACMLASTALLVRIPERRPEPAQ